MFGMGKRLLGIDEIRHLSTPDVQKQAVHTLRQANSRDDYLLVRSAIDLLLSRFDAGRRDDRNDRGHTQQPPQQTNNGQQQSRPR